MTLMTSLNFPRYIIFCLCKIRRVSRSEGLRSLSSPKLKDSSYFKKSLKKCTANDQDHTHEKQVFQPLHLTMSFSPLAKKTCIYGTIFHSRDKSHWYMVPMVHDPLIFCWIWFGSWWEFLHLYSSGILVCSFLLKSLSGFVIRVMLAS